MNDIYIYKVPNLPGHIRGLVTEIEGDYIIILRDDMDRPAALSTLQHELKHVKECDLRSECYAGQIEARTHGNT